ncbi:MAG: phosphatase [Legionella sp.]|nr:MAG: phosphatase [Legionella sp.]PJE00073.1 MAG: phosphatase [Legionella sp.]
MRLFFTLILWTCAYSSIADTIDNYMKIANNIPSMEMKADAQAQAWARSARHVLNITSESIAETLIHTNDIATQQGNPLFCLKQGNQLTPVIMNDIIQRTYKNLSSQQSDKNKMTVSQVALLGVSKQYPCHGIKKIAHINSVMRATQQHE